jgi:hypothetical protein
VGDDSSAIEAASDGRALARDRGSSGRDSVAACLIVQDEEARLPTALASVAFCDEVIVIDGGSSDRTIEIARSSGATVIENPWPGYAAQRNVGIDAAASDWVLEVDADERVSPALRASIEALLTAPPPGVAMAVCALRNRLFGGTLGPSAKYPSYRSRLFRREVYRHDESRAVHEGLALRERPLILEGDLEHELAGSLHELLMDAWRYARLESSHVASPATAGGYLTGIVLRPAAKLLYRTFVDGGWRDGWRGLMKISLDVVSDALVWALVLQRGGGDEPDPPEEAATGHFGRRKAGPPRIVAVAARGEPTVRATRWLEDLQAAGADVVLISDESGGGEIPHQSVRRIGPVVLVRALDVVQQARTADAVVPFGRRAQLLQRVMPHSLRPEIPGLGPAVGPARAIELTRLSDGPDDQHGARRVV